MVICAYVHLNNDLSVKVMCKYLNNAYDNDAYVKDTDCMCEITPGKDLECNVIKFLKNEITPVPPRGPVPTHSTHSHTSIEENILLLCFSSILHPTDFFFHVCVCLCVCTGVVLS